MNQRLYPLDSKSCLFQSNARARSDSQRRRLSFATLVGENRDRGSYARRDPSVERFQAEFASLPTLPPRARDAVTSKHQETPARVVQQQESRFTFFPMARQDVKWATWPLFIPVAFRCDRSEVPCSRLASLVWIYWSNANERANRFMISRSRMIDGHCCAF